MHGTAEKIVGFKLQTAVSWRLQASKQETETLIAHPIDRIQ